MYEYDKTILNRIYAVVGVVLLCLALYVCFFDRGRSRVHNGADREVGRIQEQQRQTDLEIGRAGNEVGAAENAVDRASGAVGSSQGRAAAVQAGIKECEELARQCQELARRNAELIDGLGKEN